MDKEYIVTLYNKEDLEQFYAEMQLNNFPLVLKRPLSRNTHYRMSEAQAEQLRQDSRVWDVIPREDLIVKSNYVNYQPYSINGDFYKSGNPFDSGQLSDSFRQWGHLHCAGDGRKTTWGGDSGNNVVTDVVEVFNSGKAVDVVIVDDAVTSNLDEWLNPISGQSRFVQYEWCNELNSLVSSIDDDGVTLPTGSMVYFDKDTLPNPEYHGNHVTSTACGDWYGWAKESNIYSIGFLEPNPSGQNFNTLLVFDYLRAFHRSKPVNPDTNKKNPTISNHSWSLIKYMPSKGQEEGETIYRLDFSDITSVVYRGVTYDALNPGPSGWTEQGIEIDFGIRIGLESYPLHAASVTADIVDTINDGVVLVGAAGNDNLLIDVPSGLDWDNYFVATGISNTYYNRGGSPNTKDSDVIVVGAMSNSENFTRASYSQFGPGIDIFAPGTRILGSMNNQGLVDTKYGANSYYYAISGTSMASPQVAGVLACAATGKDRFTQTDALGYIQKTSLSGDMNFDFGGGGFDDSTCRKGSPNLYLRAVNPRKQTGFVSENSKGKRDQKGQVYPRTSILFSQRATQIPRTFQINVTNSGASHYVFNGDDRLVTHVDAPDPVISVTVGDTLEFNLNASGHPFYIKTSPSTGTGNQITTGTISGQGTSVGTVTWNTTGVIPGTYYYICQFHGGMVGQIVVS